MIRIRRIFEELRSSYWFVPGVMALVSMALAFTSRYMDDLIPDAMWEVLAWLHGIGPAGARAVLSTIAASAISVASLVFSISILILTMASSQFGPRLIRNFMNQGAAQWTLGTFLATFIFTLLVLASVPETADVGDVPFLSVLIGLGLGLLSFAVLIFFIHHVAQMIQAPKVIADVTSRLAASIERLLPEDGKESDLYADSDSDGPPQHFDQDAQELRARASGYIQAVDLKDLVALAARRDGYVVTRRRPGQFVNREDVVGQLAPAGRFDDEDRERAEAAFVYGDQRTETQDIEFAIDQVVEIAVRALSPGINDPFTAINCIDQLGAALRFIGRRALPPRLLSDDEGTPRVYANRSDYAGLVEAAFNQIRQHGGRDAAVTIRLMEVLVGLCREALPAEMRAAVRHQAGLVAELARELPQTKEREAALDRFRRLEEQ